MTCLNFGRVDVEFKTVFAMFPLHTSTGAAALSFVSRRIDLADSLREHPEESYMLCNASVLFKGQSSVPASLNSWICISAVEGTAGATESYSVRGRNGVSNWFDRRSACDQVHTVLQPRSLPARIQSRLDLDKFKVSSAGMRPQRCTALLSFGSQNSVDQRPDATSLATNNPLGASTCVMEA